MRSPPDSGSSKSSSRSRSRSGIARSVVASAKWPERRVADRDQRVDELVAVELDRPPAELLVEVAQDLLAQVGSVGIGVLEHRVDEGAERGADRKLGHRRGQRARPAWRGGSAGRVQLLVVLAPHLGLTRDTGQRGRLGGVAERGVRRAAPGDVDLAAEDADVERRRRLRRWVVTDRGVDRRLGRWPAAIAPPGEQVDDVVVGRDRRGVGDDAGLRGPASAAGAAARRRRSWWAPTSTRPGTSRG